MDVVDAIAAAPATDERPADPVAIESTTIEQVVLPPEPSPPPPPTDAELAARLALTVDGQQLQPQTITGAGLVRDYAADDPITTGQRQIAEAQGRGLADVSIVVAGLDLASGEPLDITGLRIEGADGALALLPFAALITNDQGLTATPATLGEHDVQTLTSADQDVAITGYVDGDLVLLIRTDDEAARDELLAQLP
jgi:hypothetical protein